MKCSQPRRITTGQALHCCPALCRAICHVEPAHGLTMSCGPKTPRGMTANSLTHKACPDAQAIAPSHSMAATSALTNVLQAFHHRKTIWQMQRP
jgi:hypothetical protein